MHCPGCGAPLYAADESCPDVCSKHYPGTPDGRTPTLPFPDPVPGIDMHEFAVEDTVLVPEDIAAGDYVLSWRWDCEHSSQVRHVCYKALPYVRYIQLLRALLPGLEHVRRHHNRVKTPCGLPTACLRPACLRPAAGAAQEAQA